MAYRSLTCLVLLMAGAGAAAGSTLVVPNANATSTGNATGPLAQSAASVEIQEILGSGQMPSSPIVITGISFRAAPGTGPISATIGNLGVSLSTSPNYPNTSGSGKVLMSATFASNVGPDATTVYSGANVAVSDAGCAAPGPCPFDINIVFSTPFPYSSAAGPLLIDLKETNLSVKSGAFDAASFTSPGGSVSQVIGTLGSASGTFAYQGNIVQVMYSLPTQGPSFTGIVNPGSGVTPGLPNYGIAQGSIFTIYGSNLGPATAAQATTLPLPTTAGLGGTTVTIAGSGATPISVPILYSGSGQINAIMPSSAPVGSDTLTVTYSGASGATKIPVSPTNFGIVQFGSNQAVVTFPDYSVVTPTHSAQPGDTLVLWGTGLGPLPAGQSDAAAATGGNLPTPVQVFVGGVSANVLYSGRTPGAAGLDQINFTVPQGVVPGCSVSVVVETTGSLGAMVSNAPTTSIAVGGGTCTDATQTIPQSLVSSLSTATAPTKVLGVDLQQTNNVSYPAGSASPSNSVTASAQVYFLSFTPAQMSSEALSLNSGGPPSLNSCSTQIVNASSNSGGDTTPNATFLNAGPSLTLTPPSGPQIILSPVQTGYYAANLSALTGGTYGFSSVGGADVGPLSFMFPVPQVTWTNQNQIATSTTNRANGLTVTWTGGDANGFVVISGQAGTGSNSYAVQFMCSAPATAGSFTVPPSILLALPPSSTQGSFANISLGTAAYKTSLGSVAGFDLTLNLSTFVVNGVPLALQ